VLQSGQDTFPLKPERLQVGQHTNMIVDTTPNGRRYELTLRLIGPSKRGMRQYITGSVDSEIQKYDAQESRLLREPTLTQYEEPVCYLWIDHFSL
jgi:hypothetical protein